jgi:hypothetical protein
MIKYTLLFLLFTLFSCSDFKKKDQLEKIQGSQRNLSDIEKELKINKIDTMSKIRLATNEVELRIKNNLVLDTINLVLGKKMDDYKRMRRSLGPIGKSFEQLKTGVIEEKEALKNLKLDIQNGEGERNLYDQHITFESTKIKQLNTLLISYKGSKSEAMEVFTRLHKELDSLSMTLINSRND